MEVKRRDKGGILGEKIVKKGGKEGRKEGEVGKGRRRRRKKKKKK